MFSAIWIFLFLARARVWIFCIYRENVSITLRPLGRPHLKCILQEGNDSLTSVNWVRNYENEKMCLFVFGGLGLLGLGFGILILTSTLTRIPSIFWKKKPWLSLQLSNLEPFDWRNCNILICDNALRRGGRVKVARGNTRKVGRTRIGVIRRLVKIFQIVRLLSLILMVRYFWKLQFLRNVSGFAFCSVCVDVCFSFSFPLKIWILCVIYSRAASMSEKVLQVNEFDQSSLFSYWFLCSRRHHTEGIR